MDLAVTPLERSAQAEKSLSRDAVADKQRRKPWGLKWRASSWYITLIVAMGVMTDTLSYVRFSLLLIFESNSFSTGQAIVVPVLPYRLQLLGYSNVSGLTSWLLFAYSIGIFLFTFPVAYFFHRYPWRREPLVIAVMVLEGALILFMLARPYWVMVLSRFLQGAASTVVWTVGFALICENVAPEHVGRQLGFALAGLSIGTTIAPPIGGALYTTLGWHAPFIFCIILCAVDLIMRLFVVEQKDLKKWHLEGEIKVKPASEEGTLVPEAAVAQPPVKELSPWGVLVALARSPRGLTAFGMTFLFGLIIGVLDPTLTLRIETVWNKDSAFVGLVYLAGAAPTFVSGPLAGHLCDRLGSEWVAFPSLIVSLPWIPLLLLRSSLPGFIVYFAISNFALSCMMSPVGLELAVVATQKEGISEIHQFAAMNVAFAISSAVGAVAGGQMYDNLENGWLAVCVFCVACTAVTAPAVLWFTGNIPLIDRMRGKSEPSALETDAGETGEENLEPPSNYTMPPDVPPTDSTRERPNESPQ